MMWRRLTLRGGAQDLAVLALDFHLENLVGVPPGFDHLMGHRQRLSEPFAPGFSTP
jgi:hypothetical protein